MTHAAGALSVMHADGRAYGDVTATPSAPRADVRDAHAHPHASEVATLLSSLGFQKGQQPPTSTARCTGPACVSRTAA